MIKQNVLGRKWLKVWIRRSSGLEGQKIDGKYIKALKRKVIRMFEERHIGRMRVKCVLIGVGWWGWAEWWVLNTKAIVNTYP